MSIEVCAGSAFIAKFPPEYELPGQNEGLQLCFHWGIQLMLVHKYIEK
jgi:hypothetical protein